MKIIDYIGGVSWTKSVIKFHFENNKALNLPYHNFIHGLVVADGCLLQICEICLETPLEKHMDFVEESSLICAALFHDFNHSGGKQKDDWNVQEAIRMFNEWYKQTSDISFIIPELVISYIEATQYPYIIPKDQLTQGQRIIRDADLMQLFKYNRIQQNYLGLGQEMNVDIKPMLEGTLKFIETIDPCTDYFAERWQTQKELIKKELNILLSCYEN